MVDMTEGGQTPINPGEDGPGLVSYSKSVSGGVLHAVAIMGPGGQSLGVGAAVMPSAATALNETNTAITTAGAGTLTTAAILGRMITRSGPTGVYTDTTDTAVLIQAGWGGAVGSSFEFTIKNTVAFAQTLAGGTGVTLAGQTIIPGNSVGRFLCVWTGTGTITITGMSIASVPGAGPRASTALTTNGAGTITGAMFASGIVLRSVPTVAFTDTTDTGANIIAALPNAAVGQAFEFLYVNNTGVLATIAAGDGNVTLSGVNVFVPANSWARYLVTVATATTVTVAKVESGRNISLPHSKATSINVTTGTLSAGDASGAAICYLTSTNATPGSQAMRTPAQILADSPGLQIGMSYTLRIVNTGAGTFTLATDSGTGFTLSGTATVAQNVWTDYIVTLTGATTGTITNVGKGTYS